MSSSVTSSRSKRFLRLGRFRSEIGQFLFQFRNLPVLNLAGLAQITAALRFFQFSPLARSLPSLSAAHDDGFLVLPLRGERLGFVLQRSHSFSIFFNRSLLAGSFSFLSDWRSISNCKIWRSSWSSSVGLESSSILMRDAASSTRSIALSGRKRSVM